MRIALVDTAAYGGLLHYSVQLGEALAERGHEVDLITTRGNELEDRATRARMRPVLARPVGTTKDVRSRFLYLARRALIASRLVRAWIRIVWETRPGRYDAVLIGADVGLPPAAVGALLVTAVPGRARLVRIAHNVRAFNRSGGQALYRSGSIGDALLRHLYPRFDLVLVHGERSRAEFEELWPAKRVAVIPHGDERIFGNQPPPPADEERILFFGDWRKVKGLEVLMDAFDELAERRPTARLTIAGSPASADWDPDLLRRWAAGHDGKVRVIDHYVPVGEVPAVFREARVVATPYLAGYQSGVIHLAMTMARAVVTSDVGDLGAAVVDGKTGRVVPPGDAQALASALEELVAEPERAQRLGQEGRRRVLAEASWENVAKRVEAELEALAPRREATAGFGAARSRDATARFGAARARTAPAASPLGVAISRLDEQEFDALEPDWRRLEARALASAPYLGFDWLRAWLSTYRPDQLELVRVDNGGDIQALGLIEARRGGRWRFAGGAVTPVRALLCDPTAERESWEALSRWLADHPRRWATLEARGVRAPALLPGASTADEPVPVLRLPHSLDEYLAGRSRNMREDIRKKRRRLERAGGAVRRVPADEVDAALADFVALHRRRAEQKGEKHPSVDTRLARMLALAGAAREWSLALHEVTLDGRRLGVRVTLQGRDTSYLYNVGIDPDARRFGPGVLVTLAAIEEAIARGHTTVEMGPGVYDYKLSLGGELDERLVLEARSGSLRGQVLGLPARGYRRLVRHPRLGEPTRRLNEWRAGLMDG